MKVLLFRHGAVAGTGEKVFLGQTDLPLNAEGRRQAEAWRHYIQDRSAYRIVSSPLSRALEFARIMAGDRGADVILSPELSEIDLGDWDGRPMNEIRKADPTSWQERGNSLDRFRPPGGESFRDLQKRVMPAFEKLIAPQAPPLIIVAHAGVNRAIICAVLGMPLAHLFRFGQDYACLNVLDAAPFKTRISRINVPCPRERNAMGRLVHH